METVISESPELREAVGFLDTLVQKLYDFVITYGFRLIAAVVIIIVGFKLSKLFVNLYKKSKLYGRLDPTVGSFGKSCLSIGSKVVTIVSAASVLGVPMSSVVAAVTSAGLALGLALQGGLSNIAGGFIILVFKPFQVGDFVTFGSHSGKVKSINLFYTKLITPDNRQIMIPNSAVSNDVLIDDTALPTRRVDLTFSVSYSSDIDAVRQVILSVVAKDERIHKDPAPEVFLEKQGDSALSFVCRVYCDTENYWPVKFSLNENVKKAFDLNGIEIPFPQLDVHIDK